MNAKQITRLTKTTRDEAEKAINLTINEISEDGRWIIASDLLTITDTEDEDGGVYGVYYYRSGDEIIAVPDFYIDEDGISFTGSRGGAYELNGETLTKVN